MKVTKAEFEALKSKALEAGEEFDESLYEIIEENSKEKYMKDLHKHKNENKRLAQELAEIQRKLQSKEDEELEEKQEWKSIAEKRKEERDTLLKEKEEMKTKFIYAEAKTKIINGLGGLAKPHYASFIDVKRVIVDDEIQEDLLVAYIKELKQESPEIVAKKKPSELPADAPKEQGDGKANLKDFVKMSPQEQLQYYKNLLREENKQ